jgi:hypothetical protein
MAAPGRRPSRIFEITISFKPLDRSKFGGHLQPNKEGREIFYSWGSEFLSPLAPISLLYSPFPLIPIPHFFLPLPFFPSPIAVPSISLPPIPPKPTKRYRGASQGTPVGSGNVLGANLCILGQEWAEMHLSIQKTISLLSKCSSPPFFVFILRLLFIVCFVIYIA